MKRKPDITSDFLFVCDCREKVRQFFILNKGAINEKLQSVSPAVNGRENNIKIEKTRRANGRKKIKTIYVLRFVLRGVERTSRRGGGKNGGKSKDKKRFICFGNAFAGRGELDETGLRAGEKRPCRARIIRTLQKRRYFHAFLQILGRCTYSTTILAFATNHRKYRRFCCVQIRRCVFRLRQGARMG